MPFFHQLITKVWALKLKSAQRLPSAPAIIYQSRYCDCDRKLEETGIFYSLPGLTNWAELDYDTINKHIVSIYIL